jgi:hypothetical protein
MYREGGPQGVPHQNLVVKQFVTHAMFWSTGLSQSRSNFKKSKAMFHGMNLFPRLLVTSFLTNYFFELIGAFWGVFLTEL